MMNREFLATAAVALLMMGGAAFAGSVTALPASGSNVSGVTGNSAPGFGTGSWQQTGNTKSEYYVTPTALFGHSVAISDIESISWWTNKDTGGGAVDWYLAIYTVPTGVGDSGGWYHTRLNSEPYFASDTQAASTWKQWSTANATNPLTFFDAPRTSVFGTYNDPTLAELQAGAINWASIAGYGGAAPTVNYSSEVIGAFSLQTGTAWASGFTGLLDGLTVTLKNGDVGTVNFEAVPLPSSALMGLGLLGGLAVIGVRRRRRASELS